MPSKKVKTPLEPGKYYHIYNQGNLGQKVFYNDGDYLLFLEIFAEFMLDSVDIYAFCLLPNHYHLLMRVKDTDRHPHDASNEFRKVLLSFTNKINWQRGQRGSLFLRYFKRVEINNMDYLKRLVYYIHHNPEKHMIVANFVRYKYSSYTILTGSGNTILNREEVMDWFGGIGEFVDYHMFLRQEEMAKSLCLED